MRIVAVATIVALAGCGEAPDPDLDPVIDLPVTGRGLAVTADAIFVESDGALYVAPRNGVAPRVLAEASPELSACRGDAVIEVVGDTVYWLERDGFLHRVNLATGKTDLVFTGCAHALVTDGSAAYWNRGEGADATIWRWSADAEPELAGPSQDGVIVLDAGLLYGFEGYELVQRPLGGDGREVMYTTTTAWVSSSRVDAVHDGFLYFIDSIGVETREMRVPIGGGEVEVLGSVLGSGRTVIADGVVFKGDERLRIGDDEAETWLPDGGHPDWTFVRNIALEGDDIFYLWGEDDGPWTVFRRNKDAEPLQ